MLLRHEIERRSADPAKALELLEEAANLVPELPQVGFNRVLAMEILSLRSAAAVARRQLKREGRPQPSAAIGERLNGGRASGPANPSTDRFPIRQRAEELLGLWAEQDEPAAAAALIAEARAVSADYAAKAGDRLMSEAISAVDVALAAQDPFRVRLLREGHSGLLRLRGGNAYSACDKASLDLADSALRRAGSPFAGWVTVDRAICSFFAMDFAAAETLLEPLAAEAGRRGYLALEGRARWVLTLVRMRQGRFSIAARQCAVARRRFADLGETWHELYLRSLQAKILELMGDEEKAWKERLPALQGLVRIPDPERRFSVLEEAAQAMEGQDRPVLALAFFNEQAEAAEEARRRSGDADNLIFTLLGRQRLLRELGRFAEARASLDRAQSLWEGQSENDDTRERQRHELAVESVLLEPRPGDYAVFDHALRYVTRSATSLGDQLEVLRLLRARAAQARRFGDLAEAARSLERAVAEIERQRLEINEPDLRARFLAVARDVFDDRIALELGPGGDPWKALSYLERATNRLLLDSSLTLAGARSKAGLPALTPAAVTEAQGGALLVRYGHVADRLLLFTLAGNRLVLEQRPLTEQVLRTKAAACRAAVLKAAELTSTWETCGPLAELLLPAAAGQFPHGTPLLLVPDHLLAGVPFAALPDVSGRRPLIERHPLILAPSLSLLIQAPTAAATGERARAESALFVVDPAFDPNRHPGLDRLPAAARSAAMYSSLYPAARLLVGREASLSALLPLLDHHALFHFDGHAVEEPGRPEERGLLLAGPTAPETSTGGRDVLSAADLPRRPFRNLRRVILGGCSTAPRPYAGTSDWAGLAAAFLARGVPEVFTTSWDVLDEPASGMLLLLHRHLKAGEPGFRALQRAQLELLHSEDPLLVAPASWAAYQHLGRPPRETVGQVRPR